MLTFLTGQVCRDIESSGSLIYIFQSTGRKFHLLDLELNGVKIKGLIVAAKNLEEEEKPQEKGKSRKTFQNF